MKVLLLLGVALSGLAIAASVPGMFYFYLFFVTIGKDSFEFNFQTRSCAIMEDGLFTDQDRENSI